MYTAMLMESQISVCIKPKVTREVLLYADSSVWLTLLHLRLCRSPALMLKSQKGIVVSVLLLQLQQQQMMYTGCVRWASVWGGCAAAPEQRQQLLSCKLVRA